MNLCLKQRTEKYTEETVHLRNPPEELDSPLTVDLPSDSGLVSEDMGEKTLDTVVEHVIPKRVIRLPDKFQDYVLEKAK